MYSCEDDFSVKYYRLSKVLSWPSSFSKWIGTYEKT